VLDRSTNNSAFSHDAAAAVWRSVGLLGYINSAKLQMLSEKKLLHFSAAHIAETNLLVFKCKMTVIALFHTENKFIFI